MAFPGTIGTGSGIIGNFQGNVANRQSYSEGVGPLSWSASMAAGPLQRLFGTPMGHNAPLHHREYMGVGTTEEHLSGLAIQETTAASTYAFTEAASPVLNYLANIEISYVHQRKFTKTLYNLMPMQPQSHMSIPRFSTRSVFERMISGHRSGAAAEARYDELTNPMTAAQTRAFMITSVTSAAVFEQAQLVLACAVNEARIGAFVMTGGRRNSRHASIDKQLQEEVAYFGAFNRGRDVGVQAIERALASLEYKGPKVAFVPYSAASWTRVCLPRAEALQTMAALTISDSAAKVIGFNQMNRTGAFPLSPEDPSNFTIQSDNNIRVFIAPQNTMEMWDSETPGVLNTHPVFANWWRNPVLGNDGVRRPKSPFGDEAIYTSQYDTKQAVYAHAALPHLGVWSAYSGSGNIGSYPADMSDRALFSDHLIAHIARDKSNSNEPANHNKYVDYRRAARFPFTYVLDPEYQCREIHPFASYWAKQWFAPKHIGEMHPEALSHSATLQAAQEACEYVADHPNLRSLNAHPAELFMELFRCMDTIIANTVYSDGWAAAVTAANRRTKVNLKDGVIEFERSSRGGIVLPVNGEEYGYGTGKKLTAAYDQENFGFGCWTGPMLRELAAFDLSTHGAVMLPVINQVCSSLQTLLPKLDRVIKTVYDVMPESPMFAANRAPIWQYIPGDGLTTMIANIMGDTPAFLNYSPTASAPPVASGERLYDAAATHKDSAPKLSPESLVEELFIGDALISSEAFKTRTDALAVSFNRHVNMDSLSRWNNILKKDPSLNSGHAGKTVLLAYVHRILGKGRFSDNDTDAKLLGFLNGLTPDSKDLLSVSASDATTSDIYKKGVAIAAAGTGAADSRLWVVAYYLTEALSRIAKDATKQTLHSTPKLQHWIDAINPAGASAVPVSRNHTTDTWIRSPLGLRFSDIAKIAVAKNIQPGNPIFVHTESIPPATAADPANLPLFIDPDETDPSRIFDAKNAINRFNNSASALAYKIPVDGSRYTARDAYAGARVSDKTTRTAEHITSNLFQMHLGSSARSELLQFRNLMFNETSGGERRSFFHLMWLSYIMTPMTLHSMEALFKHQRTLPPFDIAFIKWSQIYRAADMLIAGLGAVNVAMEPLAAYLTPGTMHRMVLLNLQKKSVEWVQDHRMVYVAHSVFVERLIAGRNNGFIRPSDPGSRNASKKFEPSVFFLNRGKQENIMAVAEKISNQWAGTAVVHMDNNHDLRELRGSSTSGDTLTYAQWSTRDFYMKHVFADWYQVVVASRAARQKKWDPSTANNQSAASGISSKHSIVVASANAFRGESLRPSALGGQFSVEMPGEAFCPLSHPFWNATNHRKYLDGNFLYERTTSVTMQTVV